MMTEYWKYYDGTPDSPNRLKVGDRVNVWEDVNPDAKGLPPGTIVRIDDPDGDYDDELERPVMYGPYVWVQWDDAKPDDPEKFSGMPKQPLSYYYPDGVDEFTFDDLILVEQTT